MCSFGSGAKEAILAMISYDTRHREANELRIRRKVAMSSGTCDIDTWSISGRHYPVIAWHLCGAKQATRGPRRYEGSHGVMVELKNPSALGWNPALSLDSAWPSL